MVFWRFQGVWKWNIGLKKLQQSLRIFSACTGFRTSRTWSIRLKSFTAVEGSKSPEEQLWALMERSSSKPANHPRWNFLRKCLTDWRSYFSNGSYFVFYLCWFIEPFITLEPRKILWYQWKSVSVCCRDTHKIVKKWFSITEEYTLTPLLKSLCFCIPVFQALFFRFFSMPTPGGRR